MGEKSPHQTNTDKRKSKVKDRERERKEKRKKCKINEKLTDKKEHNRNASK